MGEHSMQNGTGLLRAYRATLCSIKGLKAAFVNESAFRQELALASGFIPLAFWLGQTTSEQLLLLAAVVMVLVVELLNSAIESIVDRVGTDYHELSGRAKDIASAAVFLTLLFAGFSFSWAAFQRFG